LCDRFTASTIAYQGYGKFLSLKNIEGLNDYSSTGLKPNLTLWLDISIDEAIKRIKNKQPDRFEKNGYSFLERVRHGFSVTADLNKTQQQKFRRGSMIRIDGSQSVELVTQRCKEVITLWSR
jgi:dTMP kinase